MMVRSLEKRNSRIADAASVRLTTGQGWSADVDLDSALFARGTET